MKNKKQTEIKTPSAESFEGNPTDSSEMINKYGTYNIQDTAETENKYPAIAQGMPESENLKVQKHSQTAGQVVKKEIFPPQNNKK